MGELASHHVSTGGTDLLAIAPTMFSQFVTQLKARPATTVVKTVDQVVGSTLKPAMFGSVVTPQAGGNMITNRSLETKTNGVPQCWQNGGYGVNTAAFSTVSPVRTGATAATLTVLGFADCDAQWLPTLGLGGCSAAAAPGTAYALSGWYKSTAPAQIEVYYSTGLEAWQYWMAGPFFVANTSYQLPAGILD